MDDILFKIRYVKENHGKPTLVSMCSRKVCAYNFVSTPYTFIGRTSHVSCQCITWLGKKYYFPTMLPLIKQFVASCYECQQYEK